MLGTDPARTGYVGDEPRTDPLGANDAGMPAAWLVRDPEPTSSVPPTAVATDGTVAAEVLARGIPVVRSLADVLALRDLGGGLGAG